jgi:F-type H+-transporting ATPase subunit epsilon
MPLSVVVVAIEGDVVYQTSEATMVVAPGVDGAMGVLAHHEPFVSLLKTGALDIVEAEEHRLIAIAGKSTDVAGYLEVHGSEVVIMADAAERAEDIDLDRAKEALSRADQLLATASSPEDVELAKAASRRAQVRVQVAGRRRATRGAEGGGP